MAKIFLNIPNETACSLYRGTLPIAHCYHELTHHGVRIIGDKGPLHEEEFSHYIFNRVINKDFYVQHIEQYIRDNKKLVWQSDDDLWNIPKWNPSSKLITKELLDMTNAFMTNALKLIVSTNELAALINKPEKTYVLPNLIDPTYFRPEGEREDGPVKLVWAGSASHDKDLDQIVEPLSKILEKYKERVFAIFWGYLPSGLANFERVPGFPHANIVPKYPNLFYGEWFNGRIYYQKLMQLQTDIAIMPLNDCKFNYSKSNLKFLEMSMSGAACIATNLPPYKCIKPNETGMLVEPEDKDAWFNCMEELIENKDLRRRLAKNARQQVIEEYSWHCSQKDKWVNALLEIARL
jgi:glycosyltransferase involved in cell wall biosynthesis